MAHALAQSQLAAEEDGEEIGIEVCTECTISFLSFLSFPPIYSVIRRHVIVVPVDFFLKFLSMHLKMTIYLKNICMILNRSE